ncbi:kinase-like domain-containing protein [Mycena belliarum]|uniref:Kinase-like domain-containing protein n=1 Tax=Mycena belliarum TaxID=1033014 RepID=A0AAD6XQV0_9AGAR|nr:kinase-like domain-containing protein [Mycena belliae]
MEPDYLPFEPHVLTSAELASHAFLLNWDPMLTGALEQLEMSMMNRAPEIRRQASSYNLRELQAQATTVMNRKCVGAHLLAVGGYNIVYLLTFEDNTDVVARLRIPGGGAMGNGIDMTPQDLSARFMSEVATMRFLKLKTSIPVPELYHSDADEFNAVGTAYMIMQRIPGVLLGRLVKQYITPAGFKTLTTQIARFEAELYDHPLSAIGCVVDPAGTVGPLVRPCTYGLVPTDRGPFTSSKGFLSACAAHALGEVRATKQWTEQRVACSEFNGGADALPAGYAEQWFVLLHDALTSLPEEARPAVFRLVHTDFNTGNLLVASATDPTIVAVLDWEGARVLPAWDARAGCTVACLLDAVAGDAAKAGLRQLYLDLTAGPGTGRVLGQSSMCWEGLMGFFESVPWVTMDKERLGAAFLRWFANAEKAGDEAELEPFRRLKNFITDDFR